MPPTTTSASGGLHLRSYPARKRGRQQAHAGHDASHHHRPELGAAGLQHGTGAIESRFKTQVVVRQDQDAVHRRNAEQGHEADRGRNAERRAADPQRKNPTQQRHRNDARGQQRVAKTAEVQVEQQYDQGQRQRYGDAEPGRPPPLEVAKFTDPLQMVPARQQDLRIDGALRLGRGAAKVAPAHAELDRNIALLLLAIDEGGTRYQSHLRHVLERDLNDATAARGCGRGDQEMRRIASRFLPGTARPSAPSSGSGDRCCPAS